MWLPGQEVEGMDALDEFNNGQDFSEDGRVLIGQNPFLFIHCFCLLVELDKQKGPACYDTLLDEISQNGTGLCNFCDMFERSKERESKEAEGSDMIGMSERERSKHMSQTGQ
ncbi:uncharacterized protein BJ212DRAFT_1302675 [Suillus subaureus]|uniref:Uncharacterized protein n=1 Tax=Suillus subaureus TaxID=48587 RepID=A0A9P7J938_9AGAM|nr:uncharacterized protein BJ212DRAFT_1302675 [Suillus subaureus]KAG1809104.1 hypothetical protein BJ212DRAFT_1302675 [Suillus subaureus]